MMISFFFINVGCKESNLFMYLLWTCEKPIREGGMETPKKCWPYNVFYLSPCSYTELDFAPKPSQY